MVVTEQLPIGLSALSAAGSLKVLEVLTEVVAQNR